MYVILGRQVKKGRRAFETHLVLHRMSKGDATRLSGCYEELKKDILYALKRGAFSI
jgi:hypothetical protein